MTVVRQIRAAGIALFISGVSQWVYASSSFVSEPLIRHQLKKAVFECLEQDPRDFSLEDLMNLLQKQDLRKITDSFSNSLLHYAAGMNHATAISKLVEMGCQIQARNCWGATPLHLAAASNRIAAIDELLRLGANPRAVNHGGQTPESIAGRMHHEEAVFLLQEAEGSHSRK